jgi:hypothetical protein
VFDLAIIEKANRLRTIPILYTLFVCLTLTGQYAYIAPAFVWIGETAMRGFITVQL